jgi:chorismate mutase/prephenate dehydratase
MSENTKLLDIRKRIDEIDEQLVELFERRMSVSLEAARIKADANLPIPDAGREQAVVERAVSGACDGLRGEVTLLMRSIMALSREYQRQRLFQTEMPLLPPPRVQPGARGQDIVCVFQGVPGAWSEQALMKLFPEARRNQVEFFEDVFTAVKEKRADYGVVAIENSQTGAIGETYDLLRKYGCFIVNRTWMDIQQCLLALPGAALSDIREVFSHPEGFRQCARFLHGRAWDQTACRNTAVAAETAARDESGRTAAIGSRRAAELNGLDILAPDIMDSANNRTSFVVIASEPEYDHNSDLISITFSTEHRAGALCETLMPFMAQGINLMRIESRPASGDKYRFFVEINGNIMNPDVYATLRQASAACEYFEVIGCYRNS